MYIERAGDYLIVLTLDYEINIGFEANQYFKRKVVCGFVLPTHAIFDLSIPKFHGLIFCSTHFLYTFAERCVKIKLN